nr:MAG TPA: protein of unknown function DUF4726 [Caudoviricetes sp.]
MFRLFKHEKKTDPILEGLRKENERLDNLLKAHEEERAEVEEEIAKAENALRQLGYTDKDFKRMEMKSKMKVI